MGWRIPITVSIALHGALAASLISMPPAERELAESDPVEIEIVRYEPKPSPEPVAPIEQKIAPKKKREPHERRSKRSAPVPTPAPRDGDEEEREGTGEMVEGSGPSVGEVGPGSGKTKDGRDLRSLDLKARISAPRFEEQGPGVVLEEPKDPNRRATSDGGFDFHDTTFSAHVGGDGTVTFDGSGHSDVDGIPDFAISPGTENEAPSGGAKWTLDVNDWILSANGDDPYSYEKRKFLEATREERLAMARAACGERLSESLAELPRRLSAIWNSKKAIEDKRETLFDLWDECAEEGSPEILRYGELARLTILDFIQKHLPEGSENAYTELELDRLNGRRLSRRPFAPYGGRM